MMHISYFSQKSTLRIPGHETYRLTGVIIFSSICRHYTAFIRSTKGSKQSMIHGYTDLIKHISPHSQPLFSQAWKTTCKCASCHYSIHSGDSSKCRYCASARTFHALLPCWWEHAVS